MQTVIIGLYLTRTGKTGARVVRYEHDNGARSYSWLGEWGAASGSYETVRDDVRRALNRRRGVQTIIELA